MNFLVETTTSSTTKYSRGLCNNLKYRLFFFRYTLWIYVYVYDKVVKHFSAQMHCSCRILTHLQVLVEEAELTEALQVMVLLPAAVKTLRMIPGTSAHPPVTQPAAHRQRYIPHHPLTHENAQEHILRGSESFTFSVYYHQNRHYIHYIPWSCNSLWQLWMCDYVMWTYGTRASCMFPHTCLPTITITNWVVNSIKQPPGSHWKHNYNDHK